MNDFSPAAATDTGACCPACAAPSAPRNAALAIACTLGPGDLKARLAHIRALSARALMTSRSDGAVLRLTYARDAAAHVREIAAQEAECCAFLRFEICEDAAGVHLTITAPDEAGDAAGELFAHFAPELARETR